MTNELRDLTDRQAITDLVHRLYVLLDERRYDELGSVYAPDVRLRFPSADMEGLDSVTAMARRRGARYDRMQHISTDIVVELEGDAARVRSNHLAFHVHDGERPGTHFDAGIVHRFDAVRTAAGWRLTRGAGDVIWSSGAAPATS